jgi:hypothetical protein
LVGTSGGYDELVEAIGGSEGKCGVPGVIVDAASTEPIPLMDVKVTKDHEVHVRVSRA